MIGTLFDTLGGLLTVAGAIFILIGGIGLFRLPNFYTRLHAAGITDTFASLLIITGLLLMTDDWLAAIKLLFILVFLLLTSPVSSHAAARAALHDPDGPRPKRAVHERLDTEPKSSTTQAEKPSSTS